MLRGPMNFTNTDSNLPNTARTKERGSSNEE